VSGSPQRSDEAVRELEALLQVGRTPSEPDEHAGPANNPVQTSILVTQDRTGRTNRFIGLGIEDESSGSVSGVDGQLPLPWTGAAIALRRLHDVVNRALVTVCLVCDSGRQEDMSARWYEKAIIYCLDVDTFQDADGDGVGDFRGLTRRLDYLARLGVNCLWLNPIHPSPGRDDGYDVTDFYNVHPKLGTLGDFAELLQAANSRGMRVMIDLVVNHTSDEHPWFVSARSSPDSPYRDWYVWSETEPPDRKQGMVFPGEQDETWTYDKTAGAWYYHRFYQFQPDLNVTNPRVRAEIKKICSFWLQLGVTGFRMDAMPTSAGYSPCSAVPVLPLSPIRRDHHGRNRPRREQGLTSGHDEKW
jgi:Alpha amylase, catalytic domain